MYDTFSSVFVRRGCAKRFRLHVLMRAHVPRNLPHRDLSHKLCIAEANSIHRWQERSGIRSLSLDRQPRGGRLAGLPAPHVAGRVLVGVESPVVAVVLAHHLLQDVVRLLQRLLRQEPARNYGQLDWNLAAKITFGTVYLSRLILMSKDSGMSGTTRSISLQTPNTTCCRG